MGAQVVWKECAQWTCMFCRHSGLSLWCHSYHFLGLNLFENVIVVFVRHSWNQIKPVVCSNKHMGGEKRLLKVLLSVLLKSLYEWNYRTLFILKTFQSSLFESKSTTVKFGKSNSFTKQFNKSLSVEKK